MKNFRPLYRRSENYIPCLQRGLQKPTASIWTTEFMRPVKCNFHEVPMSGFRTMLLKMLCRRCGTKFTKKLQKVFHSTRRTSFSVTRRPLPPNTATPELAGTSRLRTIVCQGLIPIGHPAWWKSVFDPDFKFVEANFRTFTDRVEYVEFKARTRAGGKRKRTPKVNAKGAQAEKLVSYLTKHHDYGNGNVGNYHAAESTDIARESKVSSSTVSDFLSREFSSSGSPRDGYVKACSSNALLLHWFMVKHGDSLPVRNADLNDYDENTIREKW